MPATLGTEGLTDRRADVAVFLAQQLITVLQQRHRVPSRAKYCANSQPTGPPPTIAIDARSRRDDETIGRDTAALDRDGVRGNEVRSPAHERKTFEIGDSVVLEMSVNSFLRRRIAGTSTCTRSASTPSLAASPTSPSRCVELSSVFAGMQPRRMQVPRAHRNRSRAARASRAHAPLRQRQNRRFPRLRRRDRNGRPSLLSYRA